MSVILPQTFDPAVPIDRVQEHPQNPRRGDEAALEAAIDAHGFYGAVVAQMSTGFIVAGNHRRRDLARRGEATIPVLWLDVDDTEALRILLNDNPVGDAGGYHNPTLLALLQELAATDDGLDGTGYTGDDLNRLLSQLQPSPGSLGDAAVLDVGTEHECPYCQARWRDSSAGTERLDQ